jgi:hypothetical protein
MDIETMATRRMRMRLRRTIGCLLLFLVVLWHFDGATREVPWAWRVDDGSAYVSCVVNFKDVVVLNHKEQSTSMKGVRNNLINFFLICPREPLSVFSRPIGRQCGSKIVSALGDDVFYGFGQSVVDSKDDITVIEIATQAGRYGRGEPIILEMVTKYGGTNLVAGLPRGEWRSCAERGRWAAIHKIGCQPEAGKNGTNVGAQLVPFDVFRDISLIPSGIGEPIGSLDSSLGIEASVLHLSQLAAHRIPLEQRGEERHGTYKGDYSGPNDQSASDRRESPRFPYKRVFLGICVIGLGWCSLWFSFESFEKISKSPRYMVGGIILGMIAIALIGHGLFYACLGVWGLPSLYVL